MSILEICKKHGMGIPNDTRHFLAEIEEEINFQAEKKILQSPAYNLLLDLSRPQRGTPAQWWTIEDAAKEADKILKILEHESAI